jgi:Zn-dependent metalloprotease
MSRTLGRQVASIDPTVVGEFVRRHVLSNRDLLGIDPSQLGAPVATRVTEDLWQVTIPQVHQGIPVRDGRVAATISHGNLVLMGTESWGNVRIDARPRLSKAQAVEIGFAYAGGRGPDDVMVRAPRLEIVPIAPRDFQAGEAFAGPVGAGYGHWLVWTFVFRRPPEVAHWEVMVDAGSGEVVAFVDKIQHEQRQVTGGVYPLTNTGVCPNGTQCGTMQPGWPMPFTDTGLAAPNNFTNGAGIFDFTSGTVTTTLTGRFVDIVDNCGAVSASSTTGNLNLGGSNNQHNCTTGGFSAGNTASSRSAFYEVNRIAELARGWLPSNTWLQSRLTTNVNIVDTCNAFWNGVSINFFRSGGGCRNTGEIAGVFDHEWGHGLDDNDAAGALSNSSEGYADIAAIYRLQTSCVGHGFFDASSSGACGLTVDGTGRNANENQVGGMHCNLDCSGVRDADWNKHADQTPDTALGFVCGQCTTGPGPCGRQVHCAAAPARQAAWDLAARDLQAAPFNYDSQTAFIVANKLFYQGSGNIGSWHACTCGASSNGCGATNGYMQWLAADDDNGNLNDGTPHMTAIFNAFNRHGIACATPAPVNGGCSGGPSAAPSTLTAAPGNYQVGLSWSGVAGASRYWVFRTDGHAGCNFGKTRIAEVTGTAFTDTQVANGRPYSYNVVAAGSSAACFGRASVCATATPNLPTTPDFTLSCAPSSLSIAQGGSGTSNCTVTSLNGFAAAVSLSCTGLPSGATCSFSPSPVTPPAGGNAASTATVSVAGTTATGSFPFQVRGVSGSITRTFAMNLNVTGTGGGGAQTAVFDTLLQAPRCAVVGSSCDSGASLLLGRDGRGPEPNQPNTINDSCADGTSGTFHVDESNDRIRVSTTDGTNFSPGKTVRVEATVWAWTTPSADRLDLYYAANASSPSWTLLGTLTPTVAGAQTLSATYVLPSGGLQAVRARFRFQGSAASCGTGSYNDHDDLVFAVDTPATTVVFSDDFEIDRGWTRNPSGTDTAISGLWERGDPEPTNSSGTKQLGTTVSGVNDLVTGRLAGLSAGVHDVDSGVTSIRSPAIALPASGPITLSFSYYLAHGSNSSNADFLRVRVSGATTATVFERLGAAANVNGAWATANVSLAAFAGQTVQIWIEAADASTASLVEAGVDDVRITQP